MNPFFAFEFFKNAGKKAALSIGGLLLVLGLLILFFPELLRTMIGLLLIFGALPLVLYGLKDDSGPRFTPPKQDEEIRIIYPE